MTAKYLPRASLALGQPVISVDGELRLADQPQPCMKYRNCCQCDACLLREQHPLEAPPEPKQPWDIAA